jgi:transposase
MKRFVQGMDRGQATLLPECLEDWIDADNPVRVIDAFVDALDLSEIGFAGVEPAATGRPSYHPSALLKLYIYGYLNRVQSSRRLEREAGRNLEVLWLLRRLAPDHKTIADFRKDNGPALRKVCARFVELCREMGLLAAASVAIDGSKFKAVNNRDKNFTEAKIARRWAQLEESVARYLAQLDTADRQEPSEALAIKALHLKEKMAKLESEMLKLSAHEHAMLGLADRSRQSLHGDERARFGRCWLQCADRRRDRAPSHHRARRDEYGLGSRATGTHGQSGAGGPQDQQAGGRRRPWLLQQPGDPRVPGGWHHGDTAEADDLGRQGGGPLWQAGLRLHRER